MHTCPDCGQDCDCDCGDRPLEIGCTHDCWQPGDIGPDVAQCRYCGKAFHVVDESGPGLEYCSVDCYQFDTSEPYEDYPDDFS